MGFFANGAEAFDSGGNVLEKVGLALVAAQIAVGTKGLHQALGCAEQEGLAQACEGKLAEIGIVLQELLALRAGQVHIRVVKEGGEIVFGKAKAEALVIDKPSPALVKQDVLALEITVDQTARESSQPAAEFGEGLLDRSTGFIRKIPAEVRADEVVEKVVLLPEIEVIIKRRFKLGEIRGLELGLGDRMDFGGLLECHLVQGTQLVPGVIAMSVQIITSQVLEPDAEPGFIMDEDGGHMDAQSGEAAGGGGELGIVTTRLGVNHEDHGLLIRIWPGKTVVMPVRAAFDDGLKLTGQAC